MIKFKSGEWFDKLYTITNIYKIHICYWHCSVCVCVHLIGYATRFYLN